MSVIDEIKSALPKMQQELPDDIKVTFEFDQSPYVTRAINSLWNEGLLGACLTGLMVLVFLRDWRSVLIVVLNIPLAIMSSVVGLWLCGQTINLMTLGGLALAVGILVDEATVEIENIHTQFQHTEFGGPRGAARQRSNRRPASAGDALHSRGLRSVVLHGGSGPRTVCAALTGRRLRDDRQLCAVEYVRAGGLRVADEGARDEG